MLLPLFGANLSQNASGLMVEKREKYASYVE